MLFVKVTEFTNKNDSNVLRTTIGKYKFQKYFIVLFRFSFTLHNTKK